MGTGLVSTRMVRAGRAKRRGGLGLRRSLIGCSLLLGLALLAGCGAAPPPPVTLRVCFYATQDFLPYFVMQEHGFAAQHGLRFEERSFPGGAAAIDAMVADSLDLCAGVGTVPLLAAADRGLIPGAIVAVAGTDFTDKEHLGAAVVAAPSVQSWKDLAGKRIAVNAKNSIAAGGLLGRLKLEGVNDFVLAEIPIANMGLAVAGGNVAAAAMYEPFVTQSLLRGDGKLLDWVVGGAPFERAEFTAIVVRADLLRRNPQGVKAYLRAHLQAVGWLNANLGKARALHARRLGLSREVGEQAHLLRWPGDARNDPGLLDAMQPLLIEVGLLKTLIPAQRLYDETLLDQVLAEKR